MNRRYWLKTIWNLLAVVLVLVRWEVGLTAALLGLITLVLPPATPRYRTDAPVVEGET